MKKGSRSDVHIRFMEKVEILPNGCWNFLGGKSLGYGLFWINGLTRGAHRISYFIFKGDIPKNKVLDHLCRNRWCVNPEHLEIVSMKENILRGIGLTAVNARKTKCKHGHEFTKENTYIRPDGKRDCHTCRKLRDLKCIGGNYIRI